MLSFFRLNDPYRLIVIFFLLVLIRFPFFLGDFPLILPELQWMLIGEKMSAGSQLYTELWDDVAPFSATVYWLLDELFGRSPWAYHILGILLVFFQAYLFNDLLLRNRAYTQNTYVPAFIYIILMNCFFDFSSLPPVLMSLTFILLAINNIFKRIDNQTKDEFFLNTGIYLGLATLFYLPCFLFLFSTFLSLLFFTGSIPRRYLLLVYGLYVPLVLTWFYYYWNNGEVGFSINFLQSPFWLKPNYYVEFKTLTAIICIPLFYTLLSLWSINRRSHFVNYQVRLQYAMFFVLVMAGLSFSITKDFAPYQLIIFVPAMAFFISHYFLLLKTGIMSEIKFSIFWGLIIFINWGSVYNFFPLETWFNIENMLVKETKWSAHIKDKRVLLLGDNLHVYKEAQHATPYLNWQLSQLQLNYPNYFDNISDIYQKFSDDMPEIIIDEKQIAPVLFEKIPLIGNSYEDTGIPGMYQLKSVSN